MKICVYASAAGEDRSVYRHRLKDDVIPKILEANPGIVNCTLNLVDDELSGGLPGSKMGAEDVEAGPTYDAVVEYWLGEVASRTGIAIHAALDLPGRIDAYWSQVFVAKELSEALESPPSVRLISPCYPRVGMSLPQVYRHWQEHVEKANRIHVGMNRYIQNWNMAALTPDAPAYFGTPMLSFQTLSDWQERFYCDEDGAKEIGEDVGSFVESFAPLLTREFRLK